MDWGAMGTSGVSLETLIVMGKTGTISDNAIQSPDMRVAVFKDGINKIEGYAFSNNPFTQDNNLIYVGHAGSSSINGSAFGGSRNDGNVYFNMTYDELYDALERYLDMPDYFGRNLDALGDCISEMPADESAVIFVNTAVLKENLGPYAARMLACFREECGEIGLRFIEKP